MGVDYDEAKLEVMDRLSIWPGDMFEYCAAIWRVKLCAGWPLNEVVLQKVGSDKRILLQVPEVWVLLNSGTMKRA